MADKRSYISILKPSRSNMHASVTKEQAEIFEQHCNYVKEEFAAGNIRLAGTSFESGQEHFAIVILTAEDKAAAEALINADPAVEKGLLTSRLTEFNFFVY